MNAMSLVASAAPIQPAANAPAKGESVRVPSLLLGGFDDLLAQVAGAHEIAIVPGAGSFPHRFHDLGQHQRAADYREGAAAVYQRSDPEAVVGGNALGG